MSLAKTDPSSIPVREQAIGLTLSLRRLDLLEQVYLQSKKSSSSRGSTDLDEDLLRYVLSETTAGASGNERWGVEFREEVSVGSTSRLGHSLKIDMFLL
jgi:hypothetical protein